MSDTETSRHHIYAALYNAQLLKERTARTVAQNLAHARRLDERTSEVARTSGASAAIGAYTWRGEAEPVTQSVVCSTPHCTNMKRVPVEFDRRETEGDPDKAVWVAQPVSAVVCDVGLYCFVVSLGTRAEQQPADM